MLRGALTGLVVVVGAWLILAWLGPSDSRWYHLDWLMGRPMGYGPYSTDSPNTGPTPGSRLAGQYVVVLGRSGFDPHEVTLDSGTTVRFINRSGGDYTFRGVASNDSGRQKTLFECPLLSQGEHWTYTFTEPGTYELVRTPGEWPSSSPLGRIIITE